MLPELTAMDQVQIKLLLKDYLGPSNAGASLHDILNAQADENMGAFDLAPVIQRNPAYAQFILSLSFLSQRITAWTEEDPNRQNKERVLLERVSGLLGKAMMRNLVASIAIARASGSGLPKKKGERPGIQASQILPMALKAEEDCQERKWINSELAFQGALHYDWLAAVLAARKGPKDARTVLDDAFKEGTRMAQIAYTMSLRIPQVKLGRMVYAAGLLAPIGKVLMAIIFPKGKEPSWLGFQAECDKLGSLADFARELRELSRFGEVTHPELSSLYVLSTGLLPEIEPALRFYREPERLSTMPDQFQLAMILHVAGTLTRAGTLVAGKPLPLEKFERAWIKTAGIVEAKFAEEIAALSKEEKKA